MTLDIASRLRSVRESIARACAGVNRDPAEVELLAVSKRHPTAVIRAAFAEGQRVFGENRVQELAVKDRELCDAGVAWDLIGSLQTNKVKDLIPLLPRMRYLHSLDRPRLAEVLQEQLETRDPGGPRLDVLLQIHATGEPSKHGVSLAEAEPLGRRVAKECPRLRLVGLMAMGPLDGDPSPVFMQVQQLRESMRDTLGLALPVLSIGMTHDLDVAIAHGSTMVRVGTGVFGARPQG